MNHERSEPPNQDREARLPEAATGVGHAARPHSTISPSKLHLLEISPLYIHDPTRPVHPLTAEGTLCHEALDSGDHSTLTDDQRYLVQMCEGYTTELRAQNRFVEEHRELKLDVADGIWGYADLILLTSDRKAAALVDYKFGANPQEDAENNPAAQAYTLGIFNGWTQLETVEVHYLYPRLDEISLATYVRDDVPRLRLRVETIRARVEHATTCNPTPDTCIWCGAKATCAELHRVALPIATRYGAGKQITVPPEYDPSLIANPVVMSQALTVANVMSDWADSVRFHALKLRQETGQEIPGFDLKHRSGRKRILSPQIAYELATKSGITHERFLQAVEVSAKGLADAAGDNAPRGQKTEAAQRLEDQLRDAGVLEIGAKVFYLQRSRT